MKKILAILLSLIMIIMTGCSSGTNTVDSADNSG